MADKENPLEQEKQPLDAHGRTVEEAVSQEIEEKGPVLNDWLNAKDRHTGHVTCHATYEPTPKACPVKKRMPDSETQTAAERYRGRPVREGRVQPKDGAKRFPRMKDIQNKPATNNGNGGWGK